jgi:hypothetical protein
MKRPREVLTEVVCPACDGTGFQRVKQPTQPGRKIYPPKWRNVCLSSPSEVMSRYSTSAKKVGSTHVAFGFLMGFVSFHFELTTVSSCFLIWLETVRDIT